MDDPCPQGYEKDGQWVEAAGFGKDRYGWGARAQGPAIDAMGMTDWNILRGR